jgi:hypothetical protein
MRIKSPLLYQLSYAPTKSAYQISAKLGKLRNWATSKFQRPVGLFKKEPNYEQHGFIELQDLAGRGGPQNSQRRVART